MRNWLNKEITMHVCYEGEVCGHWDTKKRYEWIVENPFHIFDVWH